MKSFFKMLLATVVGIIVTSLLFFFIILGIIGAMVSSSKTPVDVKSNSILKLTLNRPIVERNTHNPLEGIDFGGFGKEKQFGLTEIIENIKKAETDPNIKGIYLDLSFIPARVSTISDIRAALDAFKKSGKFIVAYADYYSQSAYYLASVSNKIYLNPQGSIEFTGMHTEIMFYKGALEKLGIQAEVIRHGKFKGAVEPFILDKLSDENRLQISTFVGSIWNNVLDSISFSRNISKDKLTQLANSMVLADADSCVANKIVDSLLYKDQVDAELLKLSAQTKKEPEFIELAKYEKAPKSSESKTLAKNKIAVIYAQGDVVMGDDGEGSVAADRISKALRKARTDSSVKAIVFRINSPGGSALASEIIYREVALTAKTKPIVASMGDLAASGGYYIACAADTIVANPATITGSIGVFGLMFNGKQLLNQKLGITTDVVKTNAHSDFPTFSRGMDEYEKKLIQMEIEKIYNTFLDHVSKGRGIEKQKVDDMAQGRVWSGFDAKEKGLVDLFGGLNEAIAVAAKMAKVTDYRITRLPELEDPFNQIMKELTGDVKESFVKTELGEQYNYYKQYKNLLKMKGTQTRLPFDIEVY